MLLTISLGLCSMLLILLKPLRVFAKPDFAFFGSRAFASMCICMAGMAAAAQRTNISWQAAALLAGFCLSAAADCLLAVEPVLEHPQKDRGYTRSYSALLLLPVWGIHLAVLLSRPFYAMILPALVVMPLYYAAHYSSKMQKEAPYSRQRLTAVLLPYYASQTLLAAAVVYI